MIKKQIVDGKSLESCYRSQRTIFAEEWKIYCLFRTEIKEV